MAVSFAFYFAQSKLGMVLGFVAQLHEDVTPPMQINPLKEISPIWKFIPATPAISMTLISLGGIRSAREATNKSMGMKMNALFALF